MRCASLAEEMLDRGWTIEFSCDDGAVPIAQSRLQQLECNVVPALSSPEEHNSWVEERRLDAVVIDSYLLAPDVSRSLVSEIPILAIIDGETRGQSARLYVDQNYGAQAKIWSPPRIPVNWYGAPRRLAGTDYAIVPDQVRKLRTRALSPSAHSPTRIVVALGGTDAAGLTEQLVDALRDTGRPFNATVVSPLLASRPVTRDQVNQQQIQFQAPSLKFPKLLADADLVVSAAGSTLWELCCLGKPIVAMAVANNQLAAYED